MRSFAPTQLGCVVAAIVPSSHFDAFELFRVSLQTDAQFVISHASQLAASRREQS